MDPLGTSSQIDTLSGAALNNGFNTLPVNDIDSIIASNSVKSTNVRSGMNGSAQQILNTDGSYMLYGINAATGEMGLFFYAADGTLQAKYLGITDFKYRDDGTNYYQSGKLPDGSYNVAIANTGDQVTDGVQ